MAQYPWNAPSPDEPFTGFLFRLCSWAWGWGTGTQSIKVSSSSGTTAWHTFNAAIGAGSSFAPLGSQPSNAVQLVNNTGKTIDIQRAGDAGYVQLPTGAFQTIPVVADASEVMVRSSDSSALATGFGWYTFD